MRKLIIDIETDALLDNITKVHCLVAYDIDTKETVSMSSYEEMRALFKEGMVVIGHNFVRFDLPALKRIVGVESPLYVIDTLAVSWYLFPEEKKHGLEEWGERLGIQKPEIQDWSSDNLEAIIIRCQEDVKINTRLWEREERILNQLYSEEKKEEFLKYLYFKLDCVREQEEIGLSFNVEKCKETLEGWEKEKENKTREIELVMPQVAIKKKKEYKQVAVTKEGEMFVKGDLFFEAAKEAGASIEENKTITKITGYKLPNSNSGVQMKEWLYSLGWVPQHIKHVRDKKTNAVKKIPQIASVKGGGEVCESVRKLYEKEPKLELLEGLTVVSHRIGVLKAFLEDQKEGRIYPSMAGLTNTLRLKHKTVVNLPAVEKKYGKEIRELLIADEGNVLCGSDLSNIESMTRNHYIFPYDPEYVKTILEDKTFDSHTDIAKLAGMMTEEEETLYREFNKIISPTEEEKKKFSKLKEIRGKAKIVNFSALYGISKETLSRNSGMKVGECKKLLDIYWKRNFAVKKFVNSLQIQRIQGQDWILNPISGFWLSLRNERDKFSTVNQSSSVFCMDLWLMEIRKQGIKIPFQYHDEILFNTKLGEEEDTKLKINKAIELINDKLQLNVPVGCSIQFANKYSECH